MRAEPERAWCGMVTPARAVAIGLLTAAFIGVFWHWFYKQNRWCQEYLQDWGHAYVIPLISGFLVYRDWESYKREKPVSFWPGMLAVLAGLACFLFFKAGVPNHMLQGVAMLLTLSGMVLTVCGPRIFSLAFMPIAFLAFGITISESIMIAITFKLQNIAATGGATLLGLLSPIFGYSVSLSGNTIDIVKSDGTAIPLGIAEACSGMRMVIAFVALAGAVALLSCHEWWKRVAVLLVSIPVAVSMNVVRVAVLGIASLWNPEFARGDAHIFIGTVLLLPGLGLFMLAVWSLDRIFVDDTSKGHVGRLAQGPAAAIVPGSVTLGSGAFLTVLLTMTVSAVAIPLGIRAIGAVLEKEAIYPADNRLLSQVQPAATPGWQVDGKDIKENAETEAVLGTPNYLTRNYKRAGKAGLEYLALHAAYYTGTIDTVPHVPERCLVGGGWGIVAGPFTVAVPLDMTRLSTNPIDPESKRLGYLRSRLADTSDHPGQYVNMPKGLDTLKMQVTKFSAPNGSTMYAGYFFVANGSVATTANDVRLKAFDLSSKYAYYMKVQISSLTATSEMEMVEQAADLLDEVLPELMRCTPDWLAVERGEYPAASEAK